MFADVQTPERRPYEGDPRHVLRRAEERAREMGFDAFNVGPELEYYLFRDNRSTEVLDEGGYFDLTTLDAGSDVRRDTVLALERLGIDVETPPRGRPVEHEIDMRYSSALKMADDCMTYRITVKECAQVRLARDVHAQAAVRPERLRHAHPPVAVQGRPQRVLRRRQQVLPVRRRQGVHRRQLRHAREICSIFAQWVNSYKRLVPGYEAPVYVAWSRRNARRWSACRSTTRARRTRRAWSCARPIPPATRT